MLYLDVHQSPAACVLTHWHSVRSPPLTPPILIARHMPSSGSAAPDPVHDVVMALDQWIVRDVAPDQIIATGFVDGNPAKGVAMTRPLCLYLQRRAQRYRRHKQRSQLRLPSSRQERQEVAQLHFSYRAQTMHRRETVCYYYSEHQIRDSFQFAAYRTCSRK